MTRTKSEQILFDEKLKPFYEINGKEYICRKCGNNIRSKREQHYETCKGGTLKAIRKGVVSHTHLYSELCDMGCGQKSEYFHKNGKAYCCKLGNKCPVKIQKDSELKKGINPFANNPIAHPRGMLGKTPWNKGLTKETSELVKKNGEAVSLSHKLYGDQRKKIHHDEETKARISESTKLRYKNGWMNPTCGRAKSYPYNNPSEGIVHLTGTWEVALATALDKANIKWLRNKNRFDYIKPDGEAATYLPDFYIPEWHTYFEVKGYRTELDNAKWAQFKEPLIILYKKEIFEIKKWLSQSIEITECMLMKLFEDQYNHEEETSTY